MSEKSEEHGKTPTTEEKNEEKLDILNLPPRKDVHKEFKKGHVKWSKPFIRFLFVILLMLVVLAVYVYFV